MYISLLIDDDFPISLETKGINVEVKNMDSVQNIPKEIRNSKPWRKFRKSRFSSLSNEYYPVLKIVCFSRTSCVAVSLVCQMN